MITLMLALAVQDDYAAELKKLEAEYQAAETEFYRPYREAKTDEEREKVKLDYDNVPQKLYLPKFRDLARRAAGTEAGVGAWLWVVDRGGGDKEMFAEAVDALLESGLDSPRLENLTWELRYAIWALSREKVESALETIRAKSPHRAVQASAMLSLGAIVLQDPEATAEQKAEAKALFDSLIADYGDTRAGKEAKGHLTELTKLQIGMEAPDFEGTDADGVTFRLSDYRGKVVVLLFWGFW